MRLFSSRGVATSIRRRVSLPGVVFVWGIRFALSRALRMGEGARQSGRGNTSTVPLFPHPAFGHLLPLEETGEG